MRTHSPLVLDVHELLEAPGSRREIAFDAFVPELKAGLAEVPGEVHLDLVLDELDGGVLVRSTLSGSSIGQCRRCLAPVSQPFSLEGSELFRPPTDVWEDGYALSDATLDLEPMARDLIALELPTSPLCRPDCKGLCARCGADLNEGPCDCPDETDPRWSALKDLVVPGGEATEGNGGQASQSR